MFARTAIHVLPDDVAAKIAAGEVVERPASVVKELVENALDAGATEIKVEIREGGRRLIRVIDNGHGIPAGQVELAFQRHATSKLRTAEDLEHIATLGFRGEALPSIAAVSHVTMVTRAVDETVGTLLRLSGGEIVERRPRGGPPGTVVTVEHLFYNTPARRKFLRTPRTEAGHIYTYISRAAMAFPDRRFTLVSDGRLLFQSKGTGRLLDVLIETYGLEVAGQLLELEVEPGLETNVTVTGYVSPPSLHRSTRQYIDLFVNRRWVQDRSLTFAVGEAYRTLLPKGRHPIAVIQIELDPAEVDVNVHPAKTEVRFRNARAVFTAVQRLVRQTVVAQAPVPHLRRTGEVLEPPMPSVPVEHRSQLALEIQRTAEEERLAGRPPLDAERPQRLPPLRVVGQIAQTYIIAEGPEGMYLIDQHAAHERVLFEKLMAQQSLGVAQQRLLEPVAVDLTGPQLEALETHRDHLTTLGFELEPFGGETVLVRAVPEILKARDPGQALADILDDLAGLAADPHRSPMTAAHEARVIASVCKQGAVRAGQTLSHAEMQALIRDLEATQSPRTCPHGRPTMIHLTAEQLAREFGRR